MVALVLSSLRRPAGWALSLASLAAILWATLRHGDPAAYQAVPVTCLVCGAAGSVDVWRNVVLFMPLGVGLGLLGMRPLRAALLGFLLSLLVETLQLTLLVARTPTLSDVVTNTAGAALGALLALHWRGWLLPSGTQARWLTAAAAVAWVAVLALTGAGLRWSGVAAPYRLNQLPPSQGALRAFEGVVHEATLDGERVAPGARETPVAPRAAADTLRLRARVTPSYEPGMLRPLVWLHTAAWDEVLVFGQRHGSLVVRLRTASADARFSSPTFILRDAIPDDRSEVELIATLTPTTVRLRSASAEGVREAIFGKDLSLGWLLLVPMNSISLLWPPALVSAAWLAALVIPLAYWGARTRVGTSLVTIAAIATFAAGSAMLLTWAFGLAPVAPTAWAAIGAGIVAGWGIGRVTARHGGRRAPLSLRRAA